MAVLEISGLGGVGVKPESQSSLMPNASADLKAAPTLCKLRISCSHRMKEFRKGELRSLFRSRICLVLSFFNSEVVN